MSSADQGGLARSRHRRGVCEIDLCPIDAIAPGQGRAFVVGGKTISVFRQRDGKVFASDAYCPHRGGLLADGILGAGVVVCPLHGWKVELASGRCVGETASLAVYPARVVEGRIHLMLPSKERR